MIMFILGVLFLLAAIGALILTPRLKRSNAAELAAWEESRNYRNKPEQMPPGVLRLVAGVLIALSLLFIGFATVSQVPARNVGIVASYGKATGRTTGPGLHLTAPWETIEDWDGTRQAFEHNNEKSCVQVRISNLSNACVEVLVEWQTQAGRAPEQWGSYRKEFDRFVDKRVNPAITTALNQAFADHDPLANIDSKDGKLNVPLAPFAVQTATNIATAIGSDVKVLNVAVTRINYDKTTQDNIEKYQQAILKSRVLEKEAANAALQKAITETNAKVDKQTRCMELAEKLNKEPGYCMWTNGFPASK